MKTSAGSGDCNVPGLPKLSFDINQWLPVSCQGWIFSLWLFSVKGNVFLGSMGLLGPPNSYAHSFSDGLQDLAMPPSVTRAKGLSTTAEDVI